MRENTICLLIMIETDLKFCENELNEVINIFEGGNNLDIRHIFSEKDDRIVNTVVVGGESYAYGNLIKDSDDPVVRKRLLKRYAKLSLYKALSRHLKQEHPWGALTGIRPTKLAYQQIEETGEFKEFFTDTMKVSAEKTALVQEVLDSQKGIYRKDDDNTDFFVFVPFCPSRCKYCSFISADMKSAAPYADEYVNTVVKEIKESSRFVKKLRSVYIGGGTPTALSDAQLERILIAIDDVNTGVEYTVEAGRPDCITKSNLAMLKRHGVTRICVNPQTFNDDTLKRLGRNHTAKDVIDKYLLAKDDFIVNMDLIAGLEGETFEDFVNSINTAVSLSPDNVTVHTLCIKRGSYLAEAEKRLTAGNVSEMVDYAKRVLEQNGYFPYYLYRQKYMAGNLENVGYCKPGKACVYNVNVMEEISSTVACGANAISKRVFGGGQRIEREAAPKDVKTYIGKIDAVLSAKTKLFS